MIGGDNVFKVGSDSINKDLRHYLIASITKADGSKLLNGFRLISFWDDADGGVIYGLGKGL